MLGFQRCRLPNSHTPWKTPKKRLLLDRLVVWEKCRILFKRICIIFKNGNNLLKLRSLIWVSGPALINEMAKCQGAIRWKRRSSILKKKKHNWCKTWEKNDNGEQHRELCCRDKIKKITQYHGLTTGVTPWD